MHAETAILRDLLAGQSTADSLAVRCRIHAGVTEAVLHRLRNQGMVILSHTSGLPVWRLHERTREQLQNPAPTTTTP